MLMLVIGVVSFSALAQNGKKSKINNFSNKKVYTEKDFQVNGKKPKIMISKIVSTKMIRNFIESDEEIHVIGFLDETNEREKGIRYKPFDIKFTENQDWVKKIYFKNGVIYIWDN